jgi:hydroxylamine reductase
MFCNQCQETAGNIGCDFHGICGKDSQTAALQDYLLYALKGLSVASVRARTLSIPADASNDLFVAEALFATLTNVNFDPQRIYDLTRETFRRRDALLEQLQSAGVDIIGLAPAELRATSQPAEGDLKDYAQAGEDVALHADTQIDPDVLSLRELLTYGLKGLAAYCDHAAILGHIDAQLFGFLQEGLAAMLDDSLGKDQLVTLAMRCGQLGAQAMALLDEANTSRFGHPTPTQVATGVRPGQPGILVSGHDLLDLYELLEQTAGAGVLVYTHGEMLPAHAYPAFKAFPHLAGNYGGAWWEQQRDFAAFNGPILMTTNCLQAPRPSYQDRIFTTGVVGWEGVHHVAGRQPGRQKDFGPMIEMAKKCLPPLELENGHVMTGFAHQAVLGVADAVLDAVRSGAIRRFVVMAGCDGRQGERAYYTDVARALPPDAMILTAGCAKYRYNKLDLGTIGGLPRVLDAGQCNDSYSLVVIAQKLAKAVGAAHINDLPISFDISWYEQKAVLVLLALLSMGVKGIRLGPTLPAFLSPNVASLLVRAFDIKPISTPAKDVAAMMAGR